MTRAWRRAGVRSEWTVLYDAWGNVASVQHFDQRESTPRRALDTRALARRTVPANKKAA